MKKGEMGAHVARMGEIINSHTILSGKPEWKRPFRRPQIR